MTIEESDICRWFSSFWVIQELKPCVYVAVIFLIKDYDMLNEDSDLWF